MGTENPILQESTIPGSKGTFFPFLSTRRRRKRNKLAPWMEEAPLWLRIGKAILLLFIAIVMLFPFVNIVAISFSSARDVVEGGLILFPKNPTLDSYRALLNGNIVLRSMTVTIGLTLVGTAVQMVFTTALAYGLSKPGVPGSKFFLALVLGSFLFGPGMIPSYLLIKELGLIDNYAALIFPGLIGAWNLIILRSFFQNLPQELIDSARIDGANDLRVLFGIVLPLSKAVLAVVALFYGVGLWNTFFSAILYMNDSTKWPIQVVLRQYVIEGSSITSAADFPPGQPPPPAQSLQMAMVVLATVPILLVYPFLQKYFTKGVLTGAIKG
jgi:ABC-type glycerol-3-phosphate transport system permease component